MARRVVLIGPPGSGKGTQASRVARRYQIPHISTGDILRQAVKDGTDLGKRVAAIIAEGELVDDQLISKLVAERLTRPDTGSGFLLDGFPRTLAQADVLDVLYPELIVIHLSVPDEQIVERLSSRRICAACGITQSIAGSELPESACPYCGGMLVKREDDEPETVRRRLRTYAAQAQPLLTLYRGRAGFLGIDGTQSPEKVSAQMFAALETVRGD